jgi:cellulose synthase/poly-beta-1,6-N-acetylglucosamine synthase-like glycosyltransferase
VRRGGTAAASGALTVATSIVGILAGYLGGITVSAAATRSPAPGKWPAPPPSKRKLAILVPAHNEALAIDRALEGFANLEYPPELFSVHVVADNCSDGTAAAVRAAGFDVHERFDVDSPGKGPALNWLYHRLRSNGSNFDAIVIVDADTTLDPRFLGYVAAAMDDGAAVVQGYYGVRDADDSPAEALRYAALACRHHVRPLGRTAIGASCGLYGNGMAFVTELMDHRSWTGHLTEDMEFQMELLLDGHLVRYVPGAKLAAEMPGTLESAESQNERWELGRLQMAHRYAPTLARRIIGRRRGRVANADALLDHLVPPLSVLIALNGVCGIGALTLTVLRGRRIDTFNLTTAVASSAIIVGHVLFGLRSVEAPRVMYRSLASAPRFMLWKLGIWRRVIVAPTTVQWTRTVRNEEGR